MNLLPTPKLAKGILAPSYSANGSHNSNSESDENEASRAPETVPVARRGDLMADGDQIGTAVLGIELVMT